MTKTNIMVDITSNIFLNFDQNMNKKKNTAAYRAIRQHVAMEATRKQKPRKIIMVGSSKSGKTSLIKRFLENSFTFQYKPTLEDFYAKEYKYRGYNLCLDIVDMSGAFLFPEMRDSHIQTADVIMLVYEAENLESVKEAQSIYKIIREIRQEKMPIILVGTKTDLKRGSLPPEKFQESEDVLNVINEMKGAKHILTSSKSNVQIKEAFEYGLDDVIRKIHTLSMSAQQAKMVELMEKEAWKKGPCCRIL